MSKTLSYNFDWFARLIEQIVEMQLTIKLIPLFLISCAPGTRLLIFVGPSLVFSHVHFCSKKNAHRAVFARPTVTHDATGKKHPAPLGSNVRAPSVRDSRCIPPLSLYVYTVCVCGVRAYCVGLWKLPLGGCPWVYVFFAFSLSLSLSRVDPWRRLWEKGRRNCTPKDGNTLWTRRKTVELRERKERVG